MASTSPSKWKVYSAAVAFSVIVGFSFLGVKTCVMTATPLQTLAYRFDFAFLAGVVFLAIPTLRRQAAAPISPALLISIGGYLGFMVFQTIGLQYASSIESGILFTMVPIIAKLIARSVLNEKGTWAQTLFVLLSVTSLSVMLLLGTTSFAQMNPKGILCLLVSSIAMACSNVSTRFARKQYTPYVIALFITGSGCLIYNTALLVTALKMESFRVFTSPLSEPSFLIATAFLGIPSTLVSSLLVAYMLAHLEAVKATIFGNLSTAISIVVGVVVLGEPLFGYHIVCTLLIIVGVIGTSVTGQRKQKVVS